MTTHDSAPVPLSRVSSALRTIGLVPFVGGDSQVAAIFPQLTMRFIVPQSHPTQAVAEFPRRFGVKHAESIAETVATFNAGIYLPKLTTSITDDGMVSIRMTHVFNWPVGATDAQVLEEIRAFVSSCLAMSNRLNEKYPDQWGEEA